MNTGLHRIELTKLTASSGHFRMWPERATHSRSRYLRAAFVGVMAVLTAGAAYTLANWPPPSSRGQGAAGTAGVMTAAVAVPEPAPAITASLTPDDASLYPDTAPPEAAVIDGLTISSQRWRRGGLGSNALVSFTLRNHIGRSPSVPPPLERRRNSCSTAARARLASLSPALPIARPRSARISSLAFAIA